MSYYGTKNEDQICDTSVSSLAYSGIAGEVIRTVADNTAEPVTIDEAKNYLRISLAETTFDSQITAAIVSARQELEEYTNRSFIPQTIAVTMAVSGGKLMVPAFPVVGDITVTDSEGLPVTNGNYQPARGVYKIDGYDEVNLSYAAGYTTLPQVFKDGILRLIAWNWENRGDEVVQRNLGQITGLKQYRRVY